jgi:hypothetical protein
MQVWAGVLITHDVDRTIMLKNIGKTNLPADDLRLA